MFKRENKNCICHPTIHNQHVYTVSYSVIILFSVLVKPTVGLASRSTRRNPVAFCWPLQQPIIRKTRLMGMCHQLALNMHQPTDPPPVVYVGWLWWAGLCIKVWGHFSVPVSPCLNQYLSIWSSFCTNPKYMHT